MTGYRGHKLVLHGGGIDGFISPMAWLPGEKIGVVVLSNTGNSGGGGNPLPNGVTLYLMDRMLGLPPLDWAGKARQQAFSADSADKALRAEELKNRVAGTSPSHPLNDYVGSYEHVAYGTLVISRGAQGLELVLDDLKAPLEHVHYDVFNVAPGVADGRGTDQLRTGRAGGDRVGVGAAAGGRQAYRVYPEGQLAAAGRPALDLDLLYRGVSSFRGEEFVLSRAHTPGAIEATVLALRESLVAMREEGAISLRAGPRRRRQA